MKPAQKRPTPPMPDTVSRLKRLLPLVLLCGAGAFAGGGCVYDPYYLDGYSTPPSYIVEPEYGNPYRYNQGPPRERRYRDYDPDSRYSRRSEAYGYGAPLRRGGTEYLEEEMPDAEGGELDPGPEAPGDGEELDIAGSPSDGYGSEPPARPPELQDRASPGGATGSGAPSPKINPQEVMTATKAKTAGRVKSPYPPYTELDVSGLNSGSLAKDPTNGKVFRIP